MENEKTKLIGIMPAYNEEETIKDAAISWYQALKECDKNAILMVVNDGSKDNTLNILEEINKEYPNIIPLPKENGGHGKAVIYGYLKALERNPDWIFQTDSDGQTNPNEFKILWNNRNDKKVLMGQRTNRKDGFSRLVVTRTLRMVVWVMFHVWVKDANTPFRLMEANTLERAMNLIPKDNNLPNVLLSATFKRQKLEIYYYPVEFKERQGGVNSINIPKIIKIGFKALKDFANYNKLLKKNGY